MGSTSSSELNSYKKHIDKYGSHDFGKDLYKCHKIAEELTKYTGTQYECDYFKDKYFYENASIIKSKFNKR